MKQPTCKNVVGPKIRSLRLQFSWTQEALAEYLRRLGWNISRSTLAKVEARLVLVTDSDLLYFVRLFEVEEPPFGTCWLAGNGNAAVFRHRKPK